MKQQEFFTSCCALLWLFAASLMLVGCSQPPASVSGKVTLDGQPLTTGNVSFIPTGSGPVAMGAIQSNGSYSMQTGTEQGLDPGEYIVTVAATKIDPPADPTAAAPLPVLLTPAKYNSHETTDLKAKVVGGANTFNFDLKSQ